MAAQNQVQTRCESVYARHCRRAITCSLLIFAHAFQSLCWKYCHIQSTRHIPDIHLAIKI